MYGVEYSLLSPCSYVCSSCSVGTTLYPIIYHYVSVLQPLARPFCSYYSKFHGNNCALSMKLYLKSIRMMIPRNWVCKCISRTSERCKNQIHWDFNVSLIEGEAIGQDKWSELIKWDEMSQPLRHFSVDFISLSALYRVIPTMQPQVTTAGAEMTVGRRETIRNKQKLVKAY